ncbi:MAG TPA: FG-GAP-like repeat-containing protein [Saprospiraceae bacterium]|nr:FG-GAP-like repeat-containing protein [Saprospiraceae bacterium]
MQNRSHSPIRVIPFRSDLDIAVFSDFSKGKYLKNLNGTFTDSQVLNGTAWDTHIYDMNGDGWDDILTWNNNEHVLLHENNKMGGFKTVLNINADDHSHYCVAFDFDQDQDMDIVVSDLLTGMSIYRNLGNFNFLTWQDYSPGANYRQMWFTDFDVSGSAELIGYGTGGLHVHREAQEMITAADHLISAALGVYPNPTDGKIYLTLDTPDQYAISVYDGMGKLTTEKIEFPIIDLTDRPSGIYMLVIQNLLTHARMSKIIVRQ